jgi:NADH-quinone oxidoreductase subunit L
MVTSGVYLVSRLGGLYSACPTALTVVLVVGCLTALYGAVAGLFQNDIKKALAYSTVSQLGFMFMACGVGAYDVALFHVFTHAFFKATLFLGAGAIIHSLHHEQDMRRMGGLHKLTVHGRTPFYLAYMVLCFGWYAILGLPFGSGFMSKDLIVEHLFDGHAALRSLDLAPIVGVVALFAAGITAVYMTRVMVLTFWSPSRVSDEAKAHVTGTPLTMALPLLILGCGSIAVGFLWFAPLRAQIGTPFVDYLAPVLHGTAAVAAEPHLAEVVAPEEHGANALLISAAAIAVAVIGLLIAVARWRRGPTGPSVATQPSSDPTGFGASWTWAFDRVYHVLIVLPTRWIGLILYWLVEQALVGGITYLIAEFTAFLGDGYASTQRSRLRTSLVASVAGAAIVLWIAPIAVAVNWLMTHTAGVLRSFY